MFRKPAGGMILKSDTYSPSHVFAKIFRRVKSAPVYGPFAFQMSRCSPTAHRSSSRHDELHDRCLPLARLGLQTQVSAHVKARILRSVEDVGRRLQLDDRAVRQIRDAVRHLTREARPEKGQISGASMAVASPPADVTDSEGPARPPSKLGLVFSGA